MKSRTARHTLIVRITHWVNAVAFVGLIISGYGILLAHPQFYWGDTGHYGQDAWFNTGLKQDVDQTAWGRNIHFLSAWAFALNGFIYLISSFLNGHVKHRLLPTKEQWALGHIWRDFIDHIMLRVHKQRSVRNYNFFQKLSYLSVIFALGPLMVLTGLTMSPAVTSAAPVLLDIFGGRQSARTIHFLCAVLLFGFLAIHLAQVFLMGAVKEIKAMITGSEFDQSEETKL